MIFETVIDFIRWRCTLCVTLWRWPLCWLEFHPSEAISIAPSRQVALGKRFSFLILGWLNSDPNGVISIAPSHQVALNNRFTFFYRLNISRCVFDYVCVCTGTVCLDGKLRFRWHTQMKFHANRKNRCKSKFNNIFTIYSILKSTLRYVWQGDYHNNTYSSSQSKLTFVLNRFFLQKILSAEMCFFFLPAYVCCLWQLEQKGKSWMVWSTVIPNFYIGIFSFLCLHWYD